MGCSALTPQNVENYVLINSNSNQNQNIIDLKHKSENFINLDKDKKLSSSSFEVKNVEANNKQQSKQDYLKQNQQDIELSQKYQFQFFKQRDIPDQFYCPITRQIMEEPYQISDGFTYQKKAILNWLKFKNKSPLTNQILKNKIMIENINLKKLIKQFQQRNKQYDDYSSKIQDNLIKKENQLEKNFKDSSVRNEILSKKYLIQKLKICQKKMIKYKNKQQALVSQMQSFKDGINFNKLSKKYSYLFDKLNDLLKRQKSQIQVKNKVQKVQKLNKRQYLFSLSGDNQYKVVWQNGDIYQGVWIDSKMKGCGNYKFSNGDNICNGIWQNGILKLGYYIWKDGSRQFLFQDKLNYRKQIKLPIDIKQNEVTYKGKQFQESNKFSKNQMFWYINIFNCLTKTQIQISAFRKEDKSFQIVKFSVKKNYQVYPDSR